MIFPEYSLLKKAQHGETFGSSMLHFGPRFHFVDTFFLIDKFLSQTTCNTIFESTIFLDRRIDHTQENTCLSDKRAAPEKCNGGLLQIQQHRR